MSHRLKVFTFVLLAVLTAGPAAVLPRLSAHTPTLTAPTAPAPGAPLTSPFAPFLLPAFGVIKVKDASAAGKKFKDRASAASGDYASGVQGAAQDWESKTAAANDVYVASVTDAATKGRFRQGVQGKGGKYQKNASGVGAQRYPSGIANAQDAYTAAMGPVLQAIAAVDLPPRGVKGTNQERSNRVAMALRKLKFGA